MLTLQEGLVAHFEADKALAAAAGKLYPVSFPEIRKWPSAVFQVLGVDRGQEQEGPSPLATTTVEIRFHGADYMQAVNAKEAARRRLNGFKGDFALAGDTVKIGRAALVSEGAHLRDPDLKTFFVPTTWEFMHEEALA